MRIGNNQQKEFPPITITTVVGASIIILVILTVVMLREIFPNNAFIMKYFNKGYLVIEVLIIVTIAWRIDVWRKKRVSRKN